MSFSRSLQIQLVLVRGLDFDTIAQAALPLRPLLEESSGGRPSRLNVSRLELKMGDEGKGAAAGKKVAAGAVGYVNVVVHVQVCLFGRRESE